MNLRELTVNLENRLTRPFERRDGDAGGASRDPRPRRKRQLVVVAEDERHDWEIYGKLLWYNGFDVLHAEDGEEALELIRGYVPDLIILDLMLPKMDGLELCRRLKGESATEDIPVIALSARSEREYGGRCREAGFTGYLEKPIGPVAVLRTVEGLIGRPPPPGADPDEGSPED